MKQIRPQELSALLSQAVPPVVLDVREPWEIATASLKGSVMIPMHEITTRLSELSTTQPIVCLCHHGMRSLQVAMFLERNGFETVYNLAGGINAWSLDIDPTVPTY
ncbi:MAG: rhodanese-like domain-containing protein [Burkholderiales bacterium]|nr:rhodanese-like domain-containing protein [Burkholderiales bacterium]